MVSPAKDCSCSDPSAEWVVGENKPVFLPAREGSNSKSAPAGKFKVELGNAHHGHRKSRRLWSTDRSNPAASLIKQSGRKQMASA